MDIKMPKGEAVPATSSGTVIFAQKGTKGSGFNNYGNTVAVQDSDGNVHVYGHLDNINVKKGDKVNANQPIGKAGSTGDSTGAHLHYEVRRNGELYNTINPRSYMG